MKGGSSRNKGSKASGSKDSDKSGATAFVETEEHAEQLGKDLKKTRRKVDKLIRKMVVDKMTDIAKDKDQIYPE